MDHVASHAVDSAYDSFGRADIPENVLRQHLFDPLLLAHVPDQTGEGRRCCELVRPLQSFEVAFRETGMAE